MKKMICGTLLGILLIGLLGGCGGKTEEKNISISPDDIKEEISVLPETSSDEKEDGAVTEDVVQKTEEEDKVASDAEADKTVVEEKEPVASKEPDFSNEPEAQPSVEEDKMPTGKCVYCGKEAVYVSGAWCCESCAAVYGEEDIIAIAPEFFVGEYLDEDANEPNLEIAKGDNGKYIVQVGIFRLASITDGVGEMTSEGIKFTATDPAGNPIGGMITFAGLTANVTFTDSTWDYIENGMSFQYTKSSDIPNIWDY